MQNYLDLLKSKKYHLLLIVGPTGSGKSKYIHNYSDESGIPVLDFDKILGKKLPVGKDDSYVIDFIKDFLKSYTQEQILLDKKQILYQANSDIDLLTFLKAISINKIVIATFNGYTKDGKLIHLDNKQEIDNEYELDDSYLYIEFK